MYTELQKARFFYDLHSQEHDQIKRDILWDAMWEALDKQYQGNTRQVCYVCDLLLYSHLMKRFGKISCKVTDYKNHLLRGLDKFHW